MHFDLNNVKAKYEMNVKYLEEVVQKVESYNYYSSS